MKNSKLFTLVLLLTAIMISCNNKRNHLVNSWKATDVEAKTPHVDSVKNDILTNATLTFTNDGHVEGIIETDINDGTYALTKKGKNLVIKDETGTPFPFVSTITEDQLILESDEMKITFAKK